VDVRRTLVRIVHRPHPDEPDGGSGLRIVAPNRNFAGWTTGDRLTFAACRGRYNEFGLASDVRDTISLIEGIERMCCAGLTLAPRAMAGVDD